jgi:hypothetical protein
MDTLSRILLKFHTNIYQPNLNILFYKFILYKPLNDLLALWISFLRVNQYYLGQNFK